VTPTKRLHRARQTLITSMALRSLLLAVCSASLTLLAVLALDLLLGWSVETRRIVALLPWIIGFSVLATYGWRAYRSAVAATDEAVALWFEQRIPSLRFALVTSVSEAPDAAVRAVLERTVADAPLEQTVRAASRETLQRPVAVLAGALALLALLPDGAVGRVLAPAAGDALARPRLTRSDEADALNTIVVRVRPPAYAGLPDEAHDDPATVRALLGSRVTVEGRGSGVRLLRDEGATAADVVGDRWRLVLPVPAKAEALRLSGGGRERVLVVEPVIDSVPSLRLELPQRDTVMRVATGVLPLAAALSDDLGLAAGSFELIISSGDGELYEFRTLRLASRSFGAAERSARLEGQVNLDSLKLKPGDLIHLRAVASDRNDVNGPGRGASETRTLRVARADEYDSVSVEPAPPSEPEKDAISQRMLLQLTRGLVARSRRIGPEQTTRESRRIAVDQTKLRQRVGRAVFERLGENEGEHQHFPGDGHAHGEEGTVNPDQILAAAERAANADPSRNLDNHGEETPIVAINRPLLEAYNHMWRAATELETGAPAAAIPWMERAIAALQRARAAERIYLRGRPPAVVVDLARVRLAGKNEGDPTLRTARPASDPLRAARLARFDAALGIVTGDAAAAADSLLLLRVTLPEEERSAILALDAAATALRRGGDVTLALANARRALVAQPPRRAALGAWGQ
jgi:hypothetical protein